MKAEFKLYCESGAIVAVSNVIQKACGLIVVGEVKKGNLKNKGTVCIKVDTKPPLYDEVKRIEIDHEEVIAATNGQLIGIRLANLSKEGFIQYLTN